MRGHYFISRSGNEVYHFPGVLAISKYTESYRYVYSPDTLGELASQMASNKKSIADAISSNRILEFEVKDDLISDFVNANHSNDDDKSKEAAGNLLMAAINYLDLYYPFEKFRNKKNE
jgi:hypothetical protein